MRFYSELNLLHENTLERNVSLQRKYYGGSPTHGDAKIYVSLLRNNLLSCPSVRSFSNELLNTQRLIYFFRNE